MTKVVPAFKYLPDPLPFFFAERRQLFDNALDGPSEEEEELLPGKAEEQAEADERKKDHIDRSHQGAEHQDEKDRDSEIAQFLTAGEGPASFWDGDYLPSCGTPVKARLDPFAAMISCHCFIPLSLPQAYLPVYFEVNISSEEKIIYPEDALESGEKLPVSWGKSTYAHTRGGLTIA